MMDVSCMTNLRRSGAFEAPDRLSFEHNEEAPDYLINLGPKYEGHIRSKKK